MARRGTLVECAFMIPLVRDGTRTAHQPLAWEAFLDDVDKTFVEGSTGPEALYRVKAPVSGRYLGLEHRRVEDENWRFYLAIPRARLPELEALLRRACKTFDQESIYLSVAGAVKLVYGRSRDGRRK